MPCIFISTGSQLGHMLVSGFVRPMCICLRRGCSLCIINRLPCSNSVLLKYVLKQHGLAAAPGTVSYSWHCSSLNSWIRFCSLAISALCPTCIIPGALIKDGWVGEGTGFRSKLRAWQCVHCLGALYTSKPRSLSSEGMQRTTVPRDLPRLEKSRSVLFYWPQVIFCPSYVSFGG